MDYKNNALPLNLKLLQDILAKKPLPEFVNGGGYGIDPGEGLQAFTDAESMDYLSWPRSTSIPTNPNVGNPIIINPNMGAIVSDPDRGSEFSPTLGDERLQAFTDLVREQGVGTVSPEFLRENYGTSEESLDIDPVTQRVFDISGITLEDYENMSEERRNEFNRNITYMGGKIPSVSKKSAGEGNIWAQALRNAPFFTPSLGMEGVLHQMGRAIGAPKGEKGRNLQIGLTAADTLLKGTRNVLSGVGLSKVNREARDWYMQQMAKAQRGPYRSDFQADDVNYTGGFSFAKYGGVKKYPDGGEFSPHFMYDENGNPYYAGTLQDHLRMNEMGYTHNEGMSKYPNGGEQGGEDPVIHSRFDPRYQEYQHLQNKAKALSEYKKWHRELKSASPRSGEEFKRLENMSDSLALARRYLPVSEIPKKEKPVLWTNPATGGRIYKELDMTPVTNPYTIDIAPTPWSESDDAQKQGDAFRAWVNETHPDLAEEWDLESTGRPDNDWVRSAYYELGEEYETSRKPKAKPTVKERVQTPEKQEDRFAYKTQTVVQPDGSYKMQRVPYYNLTTRENLNVEGAVFANEQGEIIPRDEYYRLYPDQQVKKYGGMFHYNDGGMYPRVGSPSNLGNQAAKLFALAMQTNNTMNTETPSPAMDNGAANNSFQVGQTVTFKYGGKMVSGKIKKIENGKIYV